MIVLDESIQDDLLRNAIAAWYSGKVELIENLRPDTIIKDEAMPTLLRRANYPTFITVNVKDFWRKTPANNSYCIIAFVVPQEDALKLSSPLRELLKLPQFSTKNRRMGTVIRVKPTEIRYYDTKRQQFSLQWDGW